MPIIPDKKKAVTVILDRMNKEGPGPTEMKPEEGTDDETQARIHLCEEIIAAVKEGSPSALDSALDAWYENRSSGGSSADTETE